MKATRAILERVALVYIVSSYLFFPAFLLRYLDFKQWTIWGDEGFTLPELFVYILLSPYYCAVFGVQFLSGAHVDGVPSHTVVYWVAYALLFAFCWLVVSRLSKRHAPSSYHALQPGHRAPVSFGPPRGPGR